MTLSSTPYFCGLRRGLSISRRRGFTLIELIVVVIIISVMIGVALPSMRSMAENNRLRASMRELMNLMKYARSEAVFNSRTTEVFLDIKKNEFWLDLRTPNEKTGRYDPKAKKATMERKRPLESGVWVKDISAYNDNLLENNTVLAIDFFPDGTASPCLITLTNKKEIFYTIEVYKSTGLVELNQGDLQTIQEKNQSLDYPLPDNYNEVPESRGTSS